MPPPTPGLKYNEGLEQRHLASFPVGSQSPVTLWSVVCSNRSLAKIRDKSLPWKLLSLAKSSSVWSLRHHPLFQPVVEKASGWFLSSCAPLFFRSQGPARISARDVWGVMWHFQSPRANP